MERVKICLALIERELPGLKLVLEPWLEFQLPGERQRLVISKGGSEFSVPNAEHSNFY